LAGGCGVGLGERGARAWWPLCALQQQQKQPQQQQHNQVLGLTARTKLQQALQQQQHNQVLGPCSQHAAGDPLAMQACVVHKWVHAPAPPAPPLRLVPFVTTPTCGPVAADRCAAVPGCLRPRVRGLRGAQRVLQRLIVPYCVGGHHLAVVPAHKRRERPQGPEMNVCCPCTQARREAAGA